MGNVWLKGPPKSPPCTDAKLEGVIEGQVGDQSNLEWQKQIQKRRSSSFNGGVRML